MRTRSLLLPIIAAAVLAGCATMRRVEGAGPARPPALRTWIGYSVGSSYVSPIFVNREAYVAMFEIVPGRGVTMVYPSYRDQSFLSDMHYADLGVQLGRGFYFTDPFGFASFQPRYYYAIASIAPLNLARLQSSLGATRRVLGRVYASYRPFDVIDRITELVVPMQPDEDWATDLFVDWPVPAPLRTFAAFRHLRCANGRLLFVDPNYPYYGCPGDTRLAVIASAATPLRPEVPVDSVVRPADSLRPRLPHGPERRPPMELSSVDADEGRRRAEPGTRPPRSPGGGIRSTSEREADRYYGDRVSRGSAGSTASSGQSVRAPSTEPARASDDAGRRQPAERGEPRAQPAPERESSGRERKPPQ
jgi:hypothetical protein